MHNDLKNKITTNLESFLEKNSSWNIVRAESKNFLSAHDQLSREYKFSSRRSTYKFAEAIIKLADEHDHDPILIAEWHKVTLIWSTHSEKAVKGLDIEMATHSDKIYQNMHQGDGNDS